MKKTIRFITVLLILTSTLFSSCSSDDNGESFGTSTGNYFPLSIGNNWKYFDISQSLITEMEITGTTSFSGQTYYQYIDDSDTFVMTHWFAKKGATYFIKSGDTTFNQDGLDITIKSYELPISIMDERFTSKISSDLISASHNASKRGRKKNQSKNQNITKKMISLERKSGASDTISAALILGDYLKSLGII